MNPINHVAIIVDGNGRWGIEHHNSRIKGHIAGVDVVYKIVKESLFIGIKCLSFYIFSTENWKRPLQEINNLFSLFYKFSSKYKDTLKNNGIKFIWIGKRDKLPKLLVHYLKILESYNCDDYKMLLCFYINYGSRDSIVRSIKSIASDVVSKKLSIEDIDESIISKYLVPYHNYYDVDMLIRTSGEYRISNFLLWELSYAELFFVDKLWPDFTVEDYKELISQFLKRKRRYGGLL